MAAGHFQDCGTLSILINFPELFVCVCVRIAYHILSPVAYTPIIQSKLWVPSAEIDTLHTHIYSQYHNICLMIKVKMGKPPKSWLQPVSWRRLGLHILKLRVECNGYSAYMYEYMCVLCESELQLIRPAKWKQHSNLFSILNMVCAMCDIYISYAVFVLFILVYKYTNAWVSHDVDYSTLFLQKNREHNAVNRNIIHSSHIACRMNEKNMQDD